MYTLDEVVFLRDHYANATTCDKLQSRVRSRVQRKSPIPPLIDGDPIDNIVNSLNTAGYCMVGVADAEHDPEKVHHFTLFNVSQRIYRLETYADDGGRLYAPRIVEWPTYREDLKLLVHLQDTAHRVGFWNGLFSSKETEDSAEPMVMYVNYELFK
jgi:hypothetical protein